MFGQRLKALRQERCVTQEQLARIIGVERSSIGKYEGKSQIIPSDDVKCKIAEYFDVSVDYLLGYSDVRKPVITDAGLSNVEQKLISDFRSLNQQGQEYILQTIFMALPIYKRDSDFPELENRA